MKTATFRYRGGTIRVAPRQGRPDLASLVLRGDAAPGAAPLARALEQARGAGYAAVVTSAVRLPVGLSLLDAGFAVRGRLILLAHDLSDVPPAGPGPRRFRRSDRDEVLAVDATAFDEFWRFDAAGFEEAVRATPSARVRVVGPPGGLKAYAIFGRSGPEGYIQRLAVHPSARRRGRAGTLLADGLTWLRRRGARRAVVNTQEDNDAALALYLSCGFERLPLGLWVMGREL